MQKKRVLITAGGTGGHLYPAQALAQQLMNHEQPIDVHFVAGGLEKNRFFDRERFSFEELPSAPLVSRTPQALFKGIKTLGEGVSQGIKILKKYRPDVVVGFGSYYTVPILLAARWLNIPIILHEANSVPGKANRWLAPLATRVGVHFPMTSSYFGAKGVEVGLPLRESYQYQKISKEEALRHYGFSPDHKTLLICGGSQGAQAINKLIEHSLATIKRLSLQVIHLTGDVVATGNLWVQYALNKIPVCVKPFEERMEMAWSAADFFIGRAGASTIAEAMEFEVPGILIPYPFATDQHQEKNGDFFVDIVKGGVKLLEPQLTHEILEQTIERISQPAEIDAFKGALKAVKQKPNQLTLSQLVLQYME